MIKKLFNWRFLIAYFNLGAAALPPFFWLNLVSLAVGIACLWASINWLREQPKEPKY